MSQKLKTILHATFLKDLENDGDNWRLGRPSTFADMLLLHRKKSTAYAESDLVSLVNWGIRYRLCKEIPVKIAELTLEAARSKFGEIDIMELYLPLLDGMIKGISGRTQSTIFELNRELDYLVVLGQLDLDADFDHLISQIADIALNLLLTVNRGD